MNIGLVIVSFFTSLTSLAYYFIAVGELIEISGNEILAQAFGLGAFLTGVAGGSAWIEKKSFFIDTPLKKINCLIKTELCVSLSGSLISFLVSTFLLFYFLFFAQDSSSSHEIPIVIVFSAYLPLYFILGLFSGFQLPLLLKWGDKTENKILVINYLGALFSGIIVNQFVSKGIPIHFQLIFILMFNGITLLTLCLMMRSFKKMAWLISFLLLGFIVLEIAPRVKENKLAAYYLGVKLNSIKEWSIFQKTIKGLGKVHRFYTPYQKIDLVWEYPHGEVFFEGNQTLYLNYRPQFDLYSYETYHESMLEGAFNLSQKVPKKILIMGGGDGLLVDLLLKKKSVERVTLVEIDPVVLALAQHHPDLTRLNHFVFQRGDERLSVVRDDAISFLRKNDQKYDAIFIDFPFPYSDEIKKLYSLEFYKMVKARLNLEGFFILDFPILEEQGVPKKGASLSSCLIHTLNKIGLNNVILFGPYAPFVFVSIHQQKKLQFNYSLLPENLRLSTYLNLLELKEESPLGPKCFFFSFF